MQELGHCHHVVKGKVLLSESITKRHKAEKYADKFAKKMISRIKLNRSLLDSLRDQVQSFHQITSFDLYPLVKDGRS